jgi:pyrroloquinoline-quinone synthase
MTTTDVFLQELDALIQSKHLLTHTFYLAWSKGELSIECLKEYAKEYYHHVQAFPTYLSALHAHTEDAATRKVLLQNLIEEEAGSPNHPELWRNFALALGVTEAELACHTPNVEISSLIAAFRLICSKSGVAEGVAALYAYESQIPKICVSKIDGLKKHYGMQSPKDWQYFSVHIAADEQHAAEERSLLKNYITPNNMAEVRASAHTVLDGLWNFLSGLCDRYNISCGCEAKVTA